jgi:hypothetical protein
MRDVYHKSHGAFGIRTGDLGRLFGMTPEEKPVGGANAA